MKNFTGCCLKGITLLTYMSPIDGKLHLKTKEQVIISWEGMGFRKHTAPSLSTNAAIGGGKNRLHDLIEQRLLVRLMSKENTYHIEVYWFFINVF